MSTHRLGKPKQRHSPTSPCPVCGHHDRAPRGQGERCHGFVSGDYVHCSREEQSGPDTPYHANSQTWSHRLTGKCPCGQEHRPAEAKPGAGGPKGKITETYDYRDDDGILVMQAVRFRPKAFRQRRPDPSARHGWAWNLDGVKLVLYRIPELAAADPAEIVWICEGEKDVDRLIKFGLVATCNPMGAGKWRDHYSPRLSGRDVVILPDNDRVGREHAQLVARSVAPFARSVKWLELPGLAEHGDVSDWLDRGHSIADLKKLAEAALPLECSADVAEESLSSGRIRAGGDALATPIGAVGAPPDSPIVREGPPSWGGRPNEADDDPHRLARAFARQRARSADAWTLRYWLGEWQRWDGSAYRPTTEREIRAELTRFIKAEFNRINVLQIRGHVGNDKTPPNVRPVTTNLVGNVMQALAGITLVGSRACLRQPAWLDAEGPFPAAEMLPARNALVHLPSFVAGGDAVFPPSPRFFCPYSLDFDFDAKAPEPVNWLTFLGARPVGPESDVKLQLWPDDPQSRDALQEWMGLNLVPDTRHQKIAAIIGPRRCGKGTIARVITALVGTENVANPTLSSLGTNFGLAPLIGKLSALISDARLSGRVDIAQVVERLLGISGEDGQTIDRKHLPAWTGMLTARFTLLSNEIPRLAETSGALAGRMVLLRLTRSFYGQEDQNLMEKLRPELPGILLWAIEGWRRLRARGYFLQPESGRPLVEELEDLSSPVGMFVKECCQVGPEHRVQIARLFTRWKEWCAEKNREQVGDESAFGRNLRSVLPDLETKVIKQSGKYSREFVGIDGTLVGF